MKPPTHTDCPDCKEIKAILRKVGEERRRTGRELIRPIVYALAIGYLKTLEHELEEVR